MNRFPRLKNFVLAVFLLGVVAVAFSSCGRSYGCPTFSHDTFSVLHQSPLMLP